MARITRKELKSDKFATEVGHTVEFFAEHRTQLIRYGAVALILVVIAAGIFFYRKQQRSMRAAELAGAVRIQETLIGETGMPGVATYPSQAEKDKHAIQAFTSIEQRFPGTEEAAVARFYLGAIAADQGKMAEAEKSFKRVADSGNEAYGSMAKLALAEIYFSTNRVAEGEKLLRPLIDDPTVFVSKEQATIALARGLEATRPQEARKLLEPLRTARPVVSQTAIAALGDVGQQ
jgi:predicted negative regulator of RcsB-dependent stress response